MNLPWAFAFDFIRHAESGDILGFTIRQRVSIALPGFRRGWVRVDSFADAAATEAFRAIYSGDNRDIIHDYKNPYLPGVHLLTTTTFIGRRLVPVQIRFSAPETAFSGLIHCVFHWEWADGYDKKQHVVVLRRPQHVLSIGTVKSITSSPLTHEITV